MLTVTPAGNSHSYVVAPTTVDAAKDFVFGDWSETENTWRNSSEYLFALAEVYLQLKPYRTHETFWQLDRWEVNRDVTQEQWIDTDTCTRLHNPELHSQLIEDGVISKITVTEPGTGWTYLDLYFKANNNICYHKADAEAYTSSGQVISVAVTDPGRGFVNAPAVDLAGPIGAIGAELEYQIDFNYIVTHLGFNTLPAEEYRVQESTTNALSDRINNLEVNIKGKLYGQDETVDKVLERIYVSCAGIGSESKPTASFLFLGPTGTGKTELAKLLGKNLDMPLLKYDMSEYGEKHSVSSLIGPPPGYVGFGDSQVGGGRLINDLSKNPHSILLFDEVEKAHPDIFNIFLQMLDEGRITGSNGKEVNCKNTIIIMTSNLGSSDSEKNNIGFGNQEKTGEDDKAIKEFFKPEFRNRVDLICKFGKLDTLAIKKIVIKFTEELKKSLLDKHDISLNLSEPVVDYLADRGYDKKMGARPLGRKIDELIRVPLSKKVLFERIKNATVTCVLVDDKIEFNVIHKSIAKVGSDGIIEISN